MEHLYIDESGSMTVEHKNTNPYFVSAIVRAIDPQKLKKLHRRFVAKHLSELKEADKGNRMFFADGRFKELKGAMLTPALKREFVTFFCTPDVLEVFYIFIDNRRITGNLFDNTARAFNYTLKLALEYFFKQNLLPRDQYTIQLDERNERTETSHFLQNYLNTELRTTGILPEDVIVNYFDSSDNKNIQVADVFANLYFSQLHTNAYSDELQYMRDNQCLKFEFKFPL